MVPDLDISRPHMARIYDYFLGRKVRVVHTIAGLSPI